MLSETGVHRKKHFLLSDSVYHYGRLQKQSIHANIIYFQLRDCSPVSVKRYRYSGIVW